MTVGSLCLYGTGRRKSSVARVKVFLGGSGNVRINGRSMDDYFGLETFKVIALQSLKVAELDKKVDVVCNVSGGGVAGQAGAIRHGIARALLNYEATDFRSLLKGAGFLTRDPRMKERKKYGLKKARRAPQFSKR